MAAPLARPSAYYAAPVGAFLAAAADEVLGALAAAHTFDLEVSRRLAWQEEIDILTASLAGLPGWLHLEFDVPRLGSRIDAVLISGPCIVPIELKCGEREFRAADYNQAWDYALDLKNFHQASHAAPILPALVATAAERRDAAWQPPHPDGVRPPFRCGARHLRDAIDEGLASASGPPIDGEAWGAALYEPTPTIIEAARALYARHSVEAISRHDAGARNLRHTTVAIEETIERSRANGEKSIAFVTGVPGAGNRVSPNRGNLGVS